MTQATASVRVAPFARAAVVARSCSALDQLTKHTIATGIAAGEQQKFLPGVNLVHVRNTGVAFSIFSGGGTLVLVFTLVALAAAARLLRAASRAAAGCGCRPACWSAARSAT